jgi:anti-sigma factor RsiW
MPRTIDDNLLVAYVDAKLDSKLAQQVKAQIDSDPVLTERVPMFRRADALLKARCRRLSSTILPPALLKRSTEWWRARLVLGIADSGSDRRPYPRHITVDDPTNLIDR